MSKSQPSKLELYGAAAFEAVSGNLSLQCLPPPRRESRLTKSTRGHRCNGFVIMVTVSSGYHDFFVNWLHHARQHIDVQSCLRAVAEDKAALRLLRADLSPANILLGGAANSGSDDGQAAFEYGSAGFGAIVRQRPRHIAKFLRQGVGVVYSDLDLVWASNPLPTMLASAMKKGRPLAENLSLIHI